MTVLAFLTDAEVVYKILKHLGLPTESPLLAPPRRLGQMDLLSDLVPDGDLIQDAPQSPEYPCRGPPIYREGDWSVELDPQHDDDHWGA